MVTLKCGLEVTQGHPNWYHSKAWVWFLFAFHSNYDRIFSHFGYSASKNDLTLKSGFGVSESH